MPTCFDTRRAMAAGLVALGGLAAGPAVLAQANDGTLCTLTVFQKPDRIAACERAIPGNPGLLRTYASLLADAGRWHEAVAAMRRLQQHASSGLGPTDLADLATYQLGAGSWQDAVDTANGPLARNQGGPRLRRVRGQALARLGREREAAADLRRWRLALLANELELRRYGALYSGDEYRDAADRLRTEHEAGAEASRLLDQLEPRLGLPASSAWTGCLLADRSTPEETIRTCALALADTEAGDVLRSEAHAKRALAHGELGQAEFASMEAIQAAVFTPAGPLRNARRLDAARRLVALKRYQPALDQLAGGELPADDPNSPKILLARAQLLAGPLENPEAALVELQAWRRLAPDSPEALEAFVSLSVQLGRGQQALEAIAASLRGREQDLQLRFLRARALAQLGDAPAARAELDWLAAQPGVNLEMIETVRNQLDGKQEDSP